jgi:hypothetical protein
LPMLFVLVATLTGQRRGKTPAPVPTDVVAVGGGH